MGGAAELRERRRGRRKLGDLLIRELGIGAAEPQKIGDQASLRSYARTGGR